MTTTATGARESSSLSDHLERVRRLSRCRRDRQGDEQRHRRASVDVLTTGGEQERRVPLMSNDDDRHDQGEEHHGERQKEHDVGAGQHARRSGNVGRRGHRSASALAMSNACSVARASERDRPKWLIPRRFANRHRTAETRMSRPAVARTCRFERRVTNACPGAFSLLEFERRGIGAGRGTAEEITRPFLFDWRRATRTNNM